MKRLGGFLKSVTPETRCYLCGNLPHEGAEWEATGVVCVAMIHDKTTESEFRKKYLKRLPKAERVRCSGVPGAGILDAHRRVKNVLADPQRRYKVVRIISDEEIPGLPSGDDILRLSYVDLQRLLAKVSETIAQLRKRHTQGVRVGPALRALSKVLVRATVEWQLRKAAAHASKMEGKKKRHRAPREDLMRKRAEWYRKPGPIPEDLSEIQDELSQ